MATRVDPLAAHGVQAPAPQPAGDAGLDQLALVPYVPTVRPRRLPAGAPWFAELLAFYAESRVVSAYHWLLWISLKALLYAPLALLWVILFMIGLLILRLLSQPELIVSGVFAVIQTIPSYSQWAAERMLSQLVQELRSLR